MNSKGFILIDSLIAVGIVSCICLLGLYVYQEYDEYLEGYDDYQTNISERYADIYNSLGECEKCDIQEDSPPQDY